MFNCGVGRVTDCYESSSK